MLYVALVAFVAAGTVAAVLAATETAVLLLSPGRVHRLVEAERHGSHAVDRLYDHRHRLRAVSALVAGIAFGAATVFGIVAGYGLGTSIAEVSTTDGGELVRTAATTFGALAGSLLMILFGHSLFAALPRTLASTNPEKIALQSAPISAPVVALLYPIVRVLGVPWRWVVELAANERTMTPWAVSADGGRAGGESDEESERQEAEEALLEAVSDFAEKIAREVMVPRTDVAALPDTATINDAIAAIEKSGFSRLPVYHKSIDDIRGVLYAKDLLVRLGRGEREIDLGTIVRKPLYVPETKPVEELLLEMRLKTHIAIVADEYGGTSGIVTLEDLLEEIVGEIADEYDRETPLLIETSAGRFVVDARLPVDDLNEAFGTDLDTDADSVGGLFTEVAGCIPEQGESVEIEGLRFTVTEREETRIRKLFVEPASPAAEGESHA